MGGDLTSTFSVVSYTAHTTLVFPASANADPAASEVSPVFKTASISANQGHLLSSWIQPHKESHTVHILRRPSVVLESSSLRSPSPSGTSRRDFGSGGTVCSGPTTRLRSMDLCCG